MPKEPQPFMFGCVKLLHHGIGSLRLSQLSTREGIHVRSEKMTVQQKGDNESV